MNNFAQFFKHNQIQQIYIAFICGLLNYVFLWVEIVQFRELGYNIQITLSLAIGCYLAFSYIVTSYIYGYSQLGKIEEEVSPIQKTTTTISLTASSKTIIQEKSIISNALNKKIDSDFHLKLSLFMLITCSIIVYCFWIAGYINRIGYIFCSDKILSLKNKLQAFYLVSMCIYPLSLIASYLFFRVKEFMMKVS